MTSFAQFGNDLYTGKRSIDFVGRQRTWYLVRGIILLLSLVGDLRPRPQPRPGVPRRVGVPRLAGQHHRRLRGRGPRRGRAVNSATDVVVTKVGGDSVRLQTEHLSDEQTTRLIAGLAKAYGVPRPT